MASRIVVSAASVNDLEEIYEIERECFPVGAFAKGHYRLLLFSPNVIFLKFCVGNEIAGFTVGSIQGIRAAAKCTIYTVDVRAGYRRRGIATALVRALEKRLIEKGCFRIVLQVRTDNVASIALFSKLNYRKTRILGNYYAHGVDGIEFEKLLGAEPG